MVNGKGVINMMNLLYFVLAGPFMVIGKIAEFICWEILDTGWKTHKRQSNQPENQEQAAYIQRLLKEKVEEKRRSDDLHGYYKRLLKSQEDIYRRDLREIEDRYRRRNRLN